jgi:hypothetical protein
MRKGSNKRSLENRKKYKYRTDMSNGRKKQEDKKKNFRRRLRMASIRCAPISCARRKPRHDTAVFGNICYLDSQVKDLGSCYPKLALSGTEH